MEVKAMRLIMYVGPLLTTVQRVLLFRSAHNGCRSLSAMQGLFESTLFHNWCNAFAPNIDHLFRALGVMMRERCAVDSILFTLSPHIDAIFFSLKNSGFSLRIMNRSATQNYRVRVG